MGERLAVHKPPPEAIAEPALSERFAVRNPPPEAIAVPTSPERWAEVAALRQ